MNRPARQPTADNGALLVAVAGAAVLVASVLWISVTTGSRLDHVNPHLPADPIGVLFALLEGHAAWPPAATWITVLLTTGLLVAGTALGVVVTGWQGRRSRVDHAAAHMGRGRDLAPISRRNATATSQRLGGSNWVGVPVGITVAGRQMLYGTAEDMHLVVAGPRTGKSTSLVIPAIIDAPGPVLTTSNKRDVTDATRDLRAEVGRVWVFDPQGIAGEQPDWWWNPLSYVTDEERAAELAAHFAAGSRNPNATTDAFFTPAGEDLLAGLLLAAASAGLPITQAFTWTTQPSEEEPFDILRTAGYPNTAAAVLGVIHAADEQRSGIYGTAQQMASCLKSNRITRWVTPDGPHDPRPQFDPAAFVTTRDTLYSLSREGAGTAGPLVTALTVATVQAAEEHATTLPGGRLATPLLGILDEAANVCRWRSLPDLYSHYGSRGIILQTVLQSWSQGTEVWGNAGMRKLWSAANIKIYAGGVAEPEFLSELSQLIGSHDLLTTTVTRSTTGDSTSRQLTQRRTLEIADLAALPRGRAIVLASGAPATLVETVPWMRARQANRIRASIAAHTALPHLTASEVPEALEARRRSGTTSE